MAWCKINKVFDRFYVRLFGDFIRVYLSKSHVRQIEIEIKTGRHWRICGNTDFAGFEKGLFFCLDGHRTRPFSIGLNLFGLNMVFSWGDGRHEGYDEHLDKYHDYDALLKVHPDWDLQKVDGAFPFSRRKPDVFKEYHISGKIHVYATDAANDKHALAVEVALPFLRYLKVSFKQPWGYAKWFGIELWANRTVGAVFSLFKHDLKIVFGKNSLDRTSNLATERALDRFLALNGKRKIPLDDIRSVYWHNTAAYRLFRQKIRERKKRE